MEEHLPEGLCIRGTFIDVDRPDDILPKRSSSAPPKKGSSFEASAADTGSEMTQLIERPQAPSKHVPLCRPGKLRNRKLGVPNSGVASTSAESNPNEGTASIQGNPNEGSPTCEQEVHEVNCPCGVVFVCTGLFCYNCGLSKCDIENRHITATTAKDAEPRLLPRKVESRQLPRRVAQTRVSKLNNAKSPVSKLNNPQSRVSKLNDVQSPVSKPIDAPSALKEKAKSWADVQDDPFALKEKAGSWADVLDEPFSLGPAFGGGHSRRPSQSTNAGSDVWETATQATVSSYVSGSPFASEHTTMTSLPSVCGSPYTSEQQGSVSPEALLCLARSLAQSTQPVQMQCPQQDNQPGGPTTLMICDIPCRQTIGKVIDAINDHGFSGSYDLVYMPPQKGRRREKHFQNIGYAFVNFKRPEYATAFACAFENYSFPNCESTKRSYTKPALVQGFEENLWRHSQQREEGCLFTFRDA